MPGTWPPPAYLKTAVSAQSPRLAPELRSLWDIRMVSASPAKKCWLRLGALQPPFRFRSQPMSRPAMGIAQKMRRSLRGRSSKPALSECLFVPGVRDSETIRRFVVDLQHPINILAGPGSPSIPELEKLGVARVSLGSAPMRATLGLLRSMAEELKSSGTYRTMEAAPSHADVNRMMG